MSIDKQLWHKLNVDGSKDMIIHKFIRLNKDYQLSPRGSVEYLSGIFDYWDISAKVNLDKNKEQYQFIINKLNSDVSN